MVLGDRGKEREENSVFLGGIERKEGLLEGREKGRESRK